MPRALWVTDEPPDRDLGGGNVRQAHLLGALAGRMDTDLLLAGPLADPLTRAVLKQIIEVRAFPRTQPRNRQVRRALDLWLAVVAPLPRDAFEVRRTRRSLDAALTDIDAAHGYDVVVVNHQALMPLLPAARTARWVAHFHNVAAERARQTAAAAPGRRQQWIYERDAVKAARLERWAVANYDAVVACSTEDAAALAGADHAQARGPVVVVPNGVDTERYAPTPLGAEPRLLLSASLNYLPNVDGALWFADEVLPLIKQAVPDVVFDVVGRSPAPAVVDLGKRPGVAVHPDVPAMGPYLAASRVVLVPLRMGTGTRLKALEGLAAARPTVGTSIGLEGLGLIDGVHARITDTPEAMAGAVVELLGSDEKARRLAEAGRRLVEERFRWETIGATFAGAMAALVPS